MNFVPPLNANLAIHNRRQNPRLFTVGDSLRNNLLRHTAIRNHYATDNNQLARGGSASTNTNWITSNVFYGATYNVGREIDRTLSNRFTDVFTQDNAIFAGGCAEFFQFLEREIQSMLVDTSHGLLMGGGIDREAFDYCQSLISKNHVEFNASLRQLFYHYYAGNHGRNLNASRWSVDMTRILDTVITKLRDGFFTQEQNSRFLELIPRLQMANRARGNNRWVWELEHGNDALLLLFTLFMIRLPSVNLNQPNVLKSHHAHFPILYENEMTSEVLSIGINDANLQSIFYFIPEYNRVFGLWPKEVRLRDTSGAPSRNFELNHKMNLLRNMVIRVSLPLRIRENGGSIAFEYLFHNRYNNLLRTLREMNPFQLSSRENKKSRFYVSLSIYANQNDVVLHVPWVLEGSLNNNISCDVSEFCDEWDRIIGNSNSGQSLGARTIDTDEFYFHFAFIRDPTLPLAAALPVAQAEEVDAPAPRNVRRRRERGLPPTRRSARVRGMQNMLVGAPYAATEKQKHFLLGSLVNRFTKSPALFQTPETRMNSCLMMSLIRCQLYLYEFDQKKCTKITTTGTQYEKLMCENMYVECITNFDNFGDQIYQCPLLVKKQDKWYVKLFEPSKWKKMENDPINPYLAGCKTKLEAELWEMAAEEIWFQLQVAYQTDIDYTDFSTYCQHFSNFFQVAIAVYDVEIRGHRVHMFTPFSKTPTQMLDDPGYFAMINIVYDQGHIHPITNLAAFLKNEARKDELRLHNYCPVCDQKQCKDLRGAKEKAFQHITNCFKTVTWETHYNKSLEKQSETQNALVKLQFRKNKVTHKDEPYYQCCQCYQDVHQHNYHEHVCYIQKKKCDLLPEDKFYVFDVEAAQFVTEQGLYKHEVNCVYLTKVYRAEGDNTGKYFPTEVEFVEELLTNDEFKDSIIFAHNGGSYDVHFILRILERLEIQHTFIPSPTSKHKFLQIHMVERNITFKDFMRFMPGSLKNIAISFEIPVGKGEFPHRFNNGTHDEYEGPIPPLNTEEDWWGLKFAKSESDKNHFIEWYQEQLGVYCHCNVDECTCTLQKWNFQNEIKKYCLLDVIVLAEIIKRFRNQCLAFEPGEDGSSFLKWKIPLLDPLRFMTLPQITMQTFIHGFESFQYDQYNFQGIVSLPTRNRGGLTDLGAFWVYLEILNRGWSLNDTVYFGNSIREYYDFHGKISVDGFHIPTKTIFLFLKCSYYGCPNCYMEHHEFNLILPERGLYASDVKKHHDELLKHLHQVYQNVVTCWECEFHPYLSPHFSPFVEKCFSTPLLPTDCFKGGRTEVFKPYANAVKKGMKIKYYDVTSLYPSVYAYHRLPLGIPTHLLGHYIDPSRFHPTASNRYFGYARVRVVPARSDLLGLLPVRDIETGRLYFPVCPLEGCWGTEEIYLAMQNGYRVEEVYELYHWEEDQSSCEHLKDYVAFFFRMKMEAEGWKKMGASSENPSEAEQLEINEKVYNDSQRLCKIRPHCVKKDPVKRALAKLYLNSLWGKWAQKPAKSCHDTIYGVQQFLELWNDTHIDQKSCVFREISPMVFKVNYNIKKEFIHSVAHGNLFIAGYVTIHARCVLHRQMLKIGPEYIIYCDTDSIIAFIREELLAFLTGLGLGKWADEYPNNLIESVFALAPKLYSIMMQKSNATVEQIKAKGVQLSLTNQSLLTFEKIKPLLEDLVSTTSQKKTIRVDNFSIFSNSTNNLRPYGEVYSRENHKDVRGIITKRKVQNLENINWEEISEIVTYPIGYVAN